MYVQKFIKFLKCNNIDVPLLLENPSSFLLCGSKTQKVLLSFTIDTHESLNIKTKYLNLLNKFDNFENFTELIVMLS